MFLAHMTALNEFQVGDSLPCDPSGTQANLDSATFSMFQNTSDHCHFSPQGGKEAEVHNQKFSESSQVGVANCTPAHFLSRKFRHFMKQQRSAVPCEAALSNSTSITEGKRK